MNFLTKLAVGNPVILFWVVMGLLAIAAATGATGAWYIQSLRLDALQAEYDGFVAKTKAEGEAAAKVVTAQIKTDELRKKVVDNENVRTHTTTSSSVKRLRDANPSSSFVPPSPTGTDRPDLICFDRAEYQRATGTFVDRARGLADEGTSAIIDLDTAKHWGQELK